jgi:hypothetical protein
MGTGDERPVHLYADDVIADLEEAASIDELVSMLTRYVRDLAGDRLAGRTLSPAEASDVRSSIVRHFEDELPRLAPADITRVLDVLAHHGIDDLEPRRAALARSAPASATIWPRTGDAAFANLVTFGRLDEAETLCLRRAADLDEDADSCTRAGDFGAATKAERARDAWLDRARRLDKSS